MNSRSTFSRWLPWPPAAWRSWLPLDLALVVLLLWGLVCAWLTLAAPVETFWSPDNGGKFIQVQNLEQRGRLDRTVDYPGRVLDPAMEFQPFPRSFSSVRGDRIAVNWPPFFAFLALPFYQRWGLYGLHLLPLLAGLGSLAVVLFLAGRLPWPWPPLVVLLVGLTTPLAFYSIEFWEHTPALFLALLGGWTLVRFLETDRRPWLLFFSLLLSLAAVLRPELYLALPAGIGTLFLVRPWRKALRPALLLLGTGALLALPALFYYWLTHGSILPPNALYLLSPLSYLQRVGPLNALGHFFVSTPADAGIQVPPGRQVAFALVALLTIVLGLIPASGWKNAFREAGFVLGLLAVFLLSGAIALRYPDHRAVHGFLILCPLLLFALPALKEPRSERLAWLGWLGSLYLLLYAGIVLLLRWRGPNGGLEWGPRYALLIYPLLVPAALAGLRRLLASRRWPMRVLYCGLFLLLTLPGLLYQVRGLQVQLNDRQESLERLIALEQYCPEDVVTDLWWLPLDMATVFGERRFFFLLSPDLLPRWAEGAAAGGVDTFCLLRMGGPIPERVTASGRTYLPEAEGRAGPLLLVRFRTAPYERSSTR